MDNSWSVEQFRNYRDQQRKAAAKKTKYRNKKKVVDGFKFDSTKEAAQYGQEKIKKAAGMIKDFKMQVRFNFVINGVYVGYYKADFVEILPDDSTLVIDVKSDFTRKLPRYRKQKKLMLACHGINIVER